MNPETDPRRIGNEKCEDCKELADYICVCQEEHLCEECLVSHSTENRTLKHRIVSLNHPLLSLFQDAEEEEDEDEKLKSQIIALQEFRNNCVEMIDSKIKSLSDDSPDALRKSCTPIPLNLHASYISNKDLSIRESKHQVQKFKELPVPGSIYRTGQFDGFECYSYKVLVTGPARSGKSCIIESFKTMHTNNNEASALVFNSILCENLKVTLEVAEENGTSGCESCLAAMIVFDLTSKDSFDHAKNLILLLEHKAVVIRVVYLIGTRLDLVIKSPYTRIASFKTIQNYANSKNLLYDEISAVNPQHVDEIFMRLIRELYKNKSNK